MKNKTVALFCILLGFVSVFLAQCAPTVLGRSNCVVTRVEGGSVIKCGHTSQTFIPDGAQGDTGAQGETGSQGVIGANGSNGHSVIVITTPATSCAAGGTTIFLFTDYNDNGTLDVSSVNEVNGLSSATICNGIQGQTGSQGEAGQNAPPTPFTPVGIVDPCGDSPGVWDEVFLQLADGTLLASMSDNVEGRNTRFSLLTPGTYQTTDGTGCTFTVDSAGSLTFESFHN